MLIRRDAYRVLLCEQTRLHASAPSYLGVGQQRWEFGYYAELVMRSHSTRPVVSGISASRRKNG